jgi:hypothetical protein
VENQPLVKPSNNFAIHAFTAWSDEKICKGHEPRRSCLSLLMRNVPQTKWGKTERSCFHWSTNTRPYQGRILWYSPSMWRKDRLGRFWICCKRIFGKRNGSKLWESCKQSFAELPEFRLQRVKKHTLPSLAFGFFSRELWWSEWWPWRTFRSTHFFNGEEISRKMELCYARRLLFDFGKRCQYHGIQATDKTKNNT